jgi:hypothetical protein
MSLIQHLENALQNNLTQCQTQLERDCCKSIGGKEIREKAQELKTQGKLSASAALIASKYGFKG